jgi:hypothetical protein
MYWNGERTSLQDDNKVTISQDRELRANLPLYLDEVNHSPTGFEWGYYGSGPSQLAYAILRSYFEVVEKLDVPTSVRRAKAHYTRFKQEFVAKWHGEEWEITSDQITFWLTTQKETENEGWV